MSATASFRFLRIASLCMFAATAALATAPPPPTSCTTNELGTGRWTVTAAQGPCTVSCYANATTNPFCDPNGACTGIEYTIVNNVPDAPNKVVTTVHDADVVFPASWYPRCVGDNVIGVGKADCAANSVLLNDAATGKYRLVVSGFQEAWPTTFVIRGSGPSFKTEACRIVGLGHDTTVPDSCVPSCGGFAPKQTVLKSEEYTNHGCTVRFTYNVGTGEVVKAELVDVDEESACTLLVNPVSSLDVKLNGVPIGPGQFGEGFLETGSSSCTSRIVAGRVYSWGNPCP